MHAADDGLFFKLPREEKTNLVISIMSVLLRRGQATFVLLLNGRRPHSKLPFQTSSHLCVFHCLLLPLSPPFFFALPYFSFAYSLFHFSFTFCMGRDGVLLFVAW